MWYLKRFSDLLGLVVYYIFWIWFLREILLAKGISCPVSSCDFAYCHFFNRVNLTHVILFAFDISVIVFSIFLFDTMCLLTSMNLFLELNLTFCCFRLMTMRRLHWLISLKWCLFPIATLRCMWYLVLLLMYFSILFLLTFFYELTYI